MGARWAFALAVGAVGWQQPALAQSELIGFEAFDGQVDLRASAVGGERGWLDGGFGKLREGGDDGAGELRLRVASVDLAWKPQFSWNLSGLLSVTHQNGQSNDLDINEAFLNFRSDPGRVRLSARAGAYWPHISLEHGGSTWQVLDSITPSAVNSWVGEEIKVLGVEAMVESELDEQELSLTGAVFLHNDMSGTLLAYRGWALHDLRLTINGDMPLPPLSAFISPYQDSITSPFWEVDGRIGYYGKVTWRIPAGVGLDFFRYDNRGDRLSSRDRQTSWRTRFWNVGLSAVIDAKTIAKSQLMWGNTLVGPDTPMGIPVDVDFFAAYALVSREVGRGRITARADWFKTADRSFVDSDDNNEEGWAAMIAYKRQVHKFAHAVVELIHVNSDRPAREALVGLSPRQQQTMLQTSLRLGF